MADAEQLALIRRSVEEWNAWREENSSARVDLGEAYLVAARLNGANLSKADLHDADLRLVHLSKANLTEADFTSANLREANLCEANLCEANLIQANLLAANLREANLNLARLHLANFFDADLRRANLTSSILSNTVFANVNLKDAAGLDRCVHHGPSVIDHRTLANSWPLPESFLRGCGLPDTLITYLPSLLSPGAIQFYSCFISYSTTDQEFADRLFGDLQNRGVRCWFAPHDVQAGKKLHEQIDDAIRIHERLLLILSPHSMGSNWVQAEIRKARKRERVEKKRVLFPVRLTSYDALRDWKLFDADEGADLATEIREYYIPDFSEWKSHDSYQREFEKLLRDLRMDG